MKLDVLERLIRYQAPYMICRYCGGKVINHIVVLEGL